MYLVTSLRPTPGAVVCYCRVLVQIGGILVTVFVVLGRVGGLLESLNKYIKC